MEHLEFPDKNNWEKREKWFNNTLNKYEGKGGYMISDHAASLLSELQALFCIGAWNSIIIIALSVIDSQVRDIDDPDFKGITKELIDRNNLNPEIDWLRKKRNKIVHINTDNPELNLNDYIDRKEQLEIDGKKVIELACEVFFLNPFI